VLTGGVEPPSNEASLNCPKQSITHAVPFVLQSGFDKVVEQVAPSVEQQNCEGCVDAGTVIILPKQVL